MQQGTRRRQFGRRSGGVAAVIAAISGGSGVTQASDADLALTVDLAMEAAGAAEMGDWSITLAASTDVVGLEPALDTVSLAGGTPTRAVLDAPLDPILARWSQPDPSPDQMVLVPLPAPLWAGICGLVMVAVGRRVGSNAR